MSSIFVHSLLIILPTERHRQKCTSLAGLTRSALDRSAYLWRGNSRLLTQWSVDELWISGSSLSLLLTKELSGVGNATACTVIHQSTLACTHNPHWGPNNPQYCAVSSLFLKHHPVPFVEIRRNHFEFFYPQICGETELIELLHL